ncbi:hypothetical protein C1645_744846 [Glomus cerebriforme]|uniref:Uncharacterized protein n=1 Tax=Glomus cerebriforme TaxID=658196 RepID=A0A397S859_9GLOM|nr:hypothetical protein C1645_744846 [Glomus cerebriforme]
MDDFSDIDEVYVTFFNINNNQVESDDNTVESEDNTDLNENEKEIIAIFSRKTRVKEVHYSTVPIEYPKTSEAGDTTAYNITGWNNPRDCWKNLKRKNEREWELNM